MGCILYKGMLEQAAKRFGTGFYILPSSVHEVILLPSARQDKCHMEELRMVVAEVNRSGAVLSDEVYYYDRDSRELAVAG